MASAQSPGDLVDALRRIVGEGHVHLGGDADAMAYGWSAMGHPMAVIRPETSTQVAEAVRACSIRRVPVVAWGGKTGLVDGARADGAIALSLDRMNRIEAIDPLNGTITVQAGAILQNVCAAAEEAGMWLPLDLGSRGSATIGGLIATNAGGNRVLRYGMMRDMVLGLEAVLADGTVVSAMNHSIKNNTGYDLRQLFIGAEGTLGIVTRAVLRIRPGLSSHDCALVACASPDDVLRLLNQLDARLGGALSAFEVMWPRFYELVTTPPARGRPILPHGHAIYALVETMGGTAEADRDRFEAALADLLEEGVIVDAVIAKSGAEIEEMWAIRDDGEQVHRDGPVRYYDVSLRRTDMVRFVEGLETKLQGRWTTALLTVFGHLGDGNLHLVVSGIPDLATDTEALDRLVYGAVGEFDGSISAEHGIGLSKRDYLGLSRNEAEIALMRRIKLALDPDNIMNPGKVLAL